MVYLHSAYSVSVTHLVEIQDKIQYAFRIVHDFFFMCVCTFWIKYALPVEGTLLAKYDRFAQSCI